MASNTNMTYYPITHLHWFLHRGFAKVRLILLLSNAIHI
jgi:hypothetical protein